MVGFGYQFLGPACSGLRDNDLACPFWAPILTGSQYLSVTTPILSSGVHLFPALLCLLQPAFKVFICGLTLLLCCLLTTNSFQGGKLDPMWLLFLLFHTVTSICLLVSHLLPSLLCWVWILVQALTCWVTLGKYPSCLSFLICRIRDMVMPTL